MKLIICSCHNITQKYIVELATNGKTLDDIVKLCGVGSDCGTCLKTVENEIKENKKMNKLDLEHELEDIIKNKNNNSRTKIEAIRILAALKGFIPPIFSVTAVADTRDQNDIL